MLRKSNQRFPKRPSPLDSIYCRVHRAYITMNSHRGIRIPKIKNFNSHPTKRCLSMLCPFTSLCWKPHINIERDPAAFSLSPTQAENFSAWNRPHELFQTESDNDMDSLMTAMQSCNLVQDVTTDCSVVASLSAALEVLTGKHSVSNTSCNALSHF